MTVMIKGLDRGKKVTSLYQVNGSMSAEEVKVGLFMCNGKLVEANVGGQVTTSWDR